ncbi:MAG: hypothetical protein MI723_18630 [Caulobacterales bacterium]|nr:hypothetical protein [Caulobacterales bacterium]
MLRCLSTLIAALAAAALMAGQPAVAGGGGGGGGDDKKQGNRIKASFTLSSEEHADEEAYEEDDPGPRAVVLPTIAAPIFSDGVLHSYLFVSVQLTVAEGVDPWKVRGRSADLRDAIIRAVHATSVGATDGQGALDEEAAIALVEEAVSGKLDPGSVESVEVLGYDVQTGRG